MDVPQVHLYHVFGDNPIADTTHFADWSRPMWERAKKPNFGRFDESMAADMMRFAAFEEEVPMVVYAPTTVDLKFDDPEVRGWGLVGSDGGMMWVQDFALDDATITPT